MRWENNINHDLREVDYTGDDWKTLAEERESLCPCGHEPTGSKVPMSELVMSQYLYKFEHHS